MKDGDLFAESPDFVGLRSVYRGCVAYGTIHPSCGLGFPTAQIHVSRNRNSTSQRIAKWAVFMGLCECSEVIHSHLASCHSQIFSDLTTEQQVGATKRQSCLGKGSISKMQAPLVWIKISETGYNIRGVYPMPASRHT